MLQKVASLSRWELMESDPKSELIFSIKILTHLANQILLGPRIFYGTLQTYLRQNPIADRVIIRCQRIKI